MTHRRTRRLASLLRVPLPFALGVLEAVWHVTAAHAPAGDLGRLSDQDIADEVYWEGDAGGLVAALVSSGVLEEHAELRLVVHGWSEHADSTLRHKLKRAGLAFWDGSPAFGHRRTDAAADEPAADHAVMATRHSVTPTVADTPRPEKNLPAVAEPSPSPVPSPAPSPQETNAPPGPPASRVGTGAGGDRHGPGDRLPDGRVVLEVDELGRPMVVSRGEGTTPRLTRESQAAVERLVAFASTLGYRFDRAGRRRLRERLLGGETESQVRAGYERQLATMQELEAHPEPDDDQELDQAVRLLGGPSTPADEAEAWDEMGDLRRAALDHRGQP